MSTVQQIVTDAFGMLNLIDINDTAPSPVEMSKGERALEQMIEAWKGNGWSIADVTRRCTVDGSTATVTSPTDPVTGLVDVQELAVGMNVSGTGVTGRIKSIDELRKTFTLTALTTIAGSPTISFAVLPFEAKLEEGISALLALRIALMAGSEVPPYVQKLASDCMHVLAAQYFRVPLIGFDPMLLTTQTQRPTIANG
jgi:hypothetical protein